MLNNRRFDLSEYLIHFFRPVDLALENAFYMPEYLGVRDSVEGSRVQALFLLRLSLRKMRIFPSWSYRSGKRTIYGPYPAVCFTDMPITAFMRTSRERASRGEKISAYALVLPKNDLFAIGALPVNYGFSGGIPDVYVNDETGERVIDPAQVALAEQYRYVAYNPLVGVDWTHEREWRWPYLGSMDNIKKLSGFDEPELDELPALYYKDINFRGAGVIVNSRADADKVIYDILTLVDKSMLDLGVFSFVLCADEINFHQIMDEKQLSDVINANSIDLEKYFTADYLLLCYYRDRMNEVIRLCMMKHDAIKTYDASNRAGVWFGNNKHPLVRALLTLGMIYVNKNHQYVLLIDELYGYDETTQENICRDIAARLLSFYPDLACEYILWHMNFNSTEEISYSSGPNLSSSLYHNET